jgi:hypothetical protein
MLSTKPAHNVIAALDNPLTTTGEKGSTAFTALGVGDPRVSLSQKLARGLSPEDMETMIDEVISRLGECTNEQKITMMHDLFTMVFQARDIDDGKGERLVSYQMYISLYEKYPDVMLALLPTYPLIYGSFKDFNLMLDMSIPKKLQNAIIDLYRRFLLYDAKIALPTYLSHSLYSDIPLVKGGEEEMEKRHTDRKINLTSKWTPKEGRKYGKWANRIAQKIFPNSIDPNNLKHFNFWLNNVMHSDKPHDPKKLVPSITPFRLTAEHLKDEHYYKQHALKSYRHLVSFLNYQIDTTETHMCRQDYSGINFNHVPAKAMKLYRHAFANKWQKGSKKGQQRFTSTDRVKCADKLDSHVQLAKKDPTKAKVHGKNLQGGELVKEYVKILTEANATQSNWGSDSTRMKTPQEIAKYEDPIMELQFQDILTHLRESGSLAGYIPVIDTSGSMTTSNDRHGKPSLAPIYTAVFLGAVVSKINIPAFKGRYMTFSSNPSWVSVPEDCSLCYAVYMMYNNPNWSGSTNFNASMKMILHAMELHNVPKTTKLKLLVASDMQFDQASGVSCYGGGSSSFHYKEVQKMYSRVGREVPLTLYWDLAASVMNFVAPANAKNVQVVSGYSHQLLRLFMQDELSSDNIEDSVLTPYDTMRLQLDLERYDLIRSIVSTVFYRNSPNELFTDFSERFPKFTKDGWDKMYHYKYTNLIERGQSSQDSAKSILEKKSTEVLKSVSHEKHNPSTIDMSKLEQQIHNEAMKIQELQKQQHARKLHERLQQLQEERKALESELDNI